MGWDEELGALTCAYEKMQERVGVIRPRSKGDPTAEEIARGAAWVAARRADKTDAFVSAARAMNAGFVPMHGTGIAKAIVAWAEAMGAMVRKERTLHWQACAAVGGKRAVWQGAPRAPKGARPSGSRCFTESRKGWKTGLGSSVRIVQTGLEGQH